ncbi:trehalose-phosphatase [uncultured Schumannella sp.]|uniref:trehalose-phosphatase n=1 Tax=uncultured Schumannella sp. TaxID=1195956 RepID=UPI0025EBB9C8|nr:trehalose-phosphatase [uncultured Schumannella sp.]
MTAELPPALIEALRSVAAVPRLLVALDFDGTLAPEVDAPEDARAIPAAQAAVTRLLALPETRVAFISGRALGSLQHVTQATPETLLVGSHGVEYRLDADGDGDPLEPHELERVQILHDVLESVVADIDQVWLEHKPAGFAVHSRLATPEDAERAQRETRARAEERLEGLTVRGGKNVLEFSVRSANKGEAVEHLRRYTHADAVFFAGDDVTDEDAFRVLHAGDVGLKSGGGDTAASFRVDGPDEVAQVLDALASLRAEAGA